MADDKLHYEVHELKNKLGRRKQQFDVVDSEIERAGASRNIEKQKDVALESRLKLLKDQQRTLQRELIERKNALRNARGRDRHQKHYEYNQTKAKLNTTRNQLNQLKVAHKAEERRLKGIAQYYKQLRNKALLTWRKLRKETRRYKPTG